MKTYENYEIYESHIISYMRNHENYEKISKRTIPI